MEPETKEFKEIKVVGLTVKATMQDAPIKCKALWENFMKRTSEIKNQIEGAWYGPSKDTPEKEHDFIALAGIGVTDTNEIPEGMEAWTIPAGKYLVFTHKGLVSEIGKVWSYIYCEYKGNFNRKGMAFEYYDKDCKPDSVDSIAYIYVPLE